MVLHGRSKEQVQKFARGPESLRFAYWPSGCAGHCGLLSRRARCPRESVAPKIAKTQTGCMQQLDDDSHLVYALAGCGRRCATLSRGIGSLSRQTTQSTGFMASVYERFLALAGLWASMRSSVFVFSQHAADVISKREYYEVAFTMAHRNASVLTQFRERLDE